MHAMHDGQWLYTPTDPPCPCRWHYKVGNSSGCNDSSTTLMYEFLLCDQSLSVGAQVIVLHRGHRSTLDLQVNDLLH